MAELTLIAIHQLSLAIGARSPALTAWLDFPDFTLNNRQSDEMIN